MAITVRQLLFRRGVLVAAVTATGVMVTLVALTPLRVLIVGIYSQPLSADAAFSSVPADFLLHVLPFGIGVFLSLWILAPIAAPLTLGFVVTRALLAALAGTVLLVLVTIALGIPGIVAPGATFLLDSSGISVDLETVTSTILKSLTFALLAVVEAAPVVALAGVFQWNWLQRHPPAFDVAGLIDEV